MEVFSPVGTESSWDVFPDSESRKLICCSMSHLLNNPDGFKEQVGPFSIVYSRLFPSHGKILTGGSEGDNVHRLYLISVHINHTAKVLHVREPALRHADRKLLNLRCPDRFNPVDGSGKREPAGTIEQTAKFHASHLNLTGSVRWMPSSSFAPITAGPTAEENRITASSLSTPFRAFCR